MTKEIDHLLKKRYKVISDWPNNPNKVGDILDGESYQKWPPWEGKYPHLFKELHWSEGVSLGDMPAYVKFYNNHLDGPSFGKVEKWELRGNGRLPIVKTDADPVRRELFELDLPATEAEYLDYLTQQNKKA